MAMRPVTKEAHEVQQIEPALSGLCHRPRSGHLFSGCQLVTIDYIFVAESAGTISGSGQRFPMDRSRLAVDSESGALRPAQPRSPPAASIPWPWPSPPDYANLYVAKQADMNIVHFAIFSQWRTHQERHRHALHDAGSDGGQPRRQLPSMSSPERLPLRSRQYALFGHHRRVAAPGKPHHSRLRDRHRRSYRDQCAGQQQRCLCHRIRPVRLQPRLHSPPAPPIPAGSSVSVSAPAAR